MTTGVHHEGIRREQCFHFLQQEEALAAAGDQSCRGCVQNQERAFDLCCQRRYMCLSRSALSVSERGEGRFRTEGAGSSTQEDFGSSEIAELRHRYASKRECRSVIA